MSNTAFITASRDQAPLSDSGQQSIHKDRATPEIRGASVDPVRDYFQQIGKFPLLNADEEIQLARQIEVGLLAKEKLESDAAASSAMRRELLQLVWEGEAANRRFISCNLRLVVSVAKRYSGRGVPLMDLIQDGNLGLDRAIKKFDYRQGFKFSTYAMWWIRQSISRSLADTSSLIRVPVHTAEKLNTLSRVRRELIVVLGREATVEELAEASNFDLELVNRLLNVDREPISLHTPVGDDATNELGDLIEDGDASAVLDIVTNEVRDDELRKRVESLPAREAEVLRYRFGLDGAAPMTFNQVGTILGVSRERVRQLETRALKLMRSPDLHEYLVD
ncbi:MAG: polymerase subunit sigma-70 [Microbacteriaceae bacterium]|nr:polymerase subunit sigma-70 [Microbacteriaceae bacterium]